MSDNRLPSDAEPDDMNTVPAPEQRPGRHRGGGSAWPGNSPGPAGGAVIGGAAGIDEATADRLLRGDAVNDPAAAAVARVLRAAAAPATPREMGRAGAVLAAYASRPHRSRVRLSRLLGVKAVAAMIAATAVGGIAVAAGTGLLPTPLHPRPSATAAEHRPQPTAEASSGRPGPVPTPSAPVESVPNIAGLCAAYEATVAAQRAKKLATPGFAPLLSAAGGPEKVADFCTALISAAPKATPSPARATPSHHSTGRPNGPPSPRTAERESAPSPDRATR